MYWLNAMGKTKYKKNDAGIKALLKSPPMLALTEKYAHGRAGANDEVKPFIGFDRAKTFIGSHKEGKE